MLGRKYNRFSYKMEDEMNTQVLVTYATKYGSTAANASAEKLKSLEINTVYPGHGKPFPMELFIRITEKKNKQEN